MQSKASVPLHVRHFRHRSEHDQTPEVTYFDTNGITTPPNRLTLIIRTDAHFATRDLKHAFKMSGFETTKRAGEKLSSEHFSKLIEQAYKAWGESVVGALAATLDYEGKYSIQPTERQHIHFHSADSLAGAVIRNACNFIKTQYAEKPDVLFISLDDMIHADVYRANASCGEFSEIGFSRLFDHTGEELGFVGRPGRPSIEKQIESVRKKLAEMRGNNRHRIPIVLLEDNVRRAKTLQWIFNEMDKGDAFKDGKLVAVATCFSVATAEERANIRHENHEIPLVIGVDYTGSTVDVVTPRDHFFDGFVVKHQDGSFGRLPSFMLTPAKIAKNFKIHPEKVATFTTGILEANMAFCETLKEGTGMEPLLNWFTPGRTIAEAMRIPETTPMRNVLRTVKNKKSHLSVVEP